VPEVRASPLRRPVFWVALLIFLDLALQSWVLYRGWQSNPLLWVPQSDGDEYWKWAARIAEGQWVGTEPFLSAPLYPYFLALVRALGGGLISVFVIQLLLRSATAALLFRLGARRLGHAGYGIAAAALFLALGEPAFFSQRILNSSLQLFLLAGFLCAADAVERRPGPRTWIPAGLLLGLNALANPTMLLLLGALPLWLGFRSRAGWRATGAVAAAALCAIAPATLHNWLATRAGPGGPELILISAQSGITYAHGNSQNAYGHYTPVPGVAVERSIQNQSAYQTAKAATGREGWKNVNSYFFRMGLDWNLAHPREALTLHLRKASYLFFGRNYSDISALAQEVRDPQLPKPVVLPGGGLPTGWLIVPALIGAGFLLARRGRGGLPETLLLLLPIAIVIGFWFSPRYRLPVAVPACLLAPYGIAALARIRPRIGGGLLCLLAVGGPLAVEAGLRAQGFDDAEIYRPEYEMHVGEAWLNHGRPAEALARFELSERLGHRPPVLYEFMGNMKLDLGRERLAAGDAAGAQQLIQESLPLFTRALELDPLRYQAWAARGMTLIWFGRKADGLADLRRGLEAAHAQNASPEDVRKLQDAIRRTEQG